MKRYVAYYRVSTKKQGRSGLGLEAQKAAVLSMAQANGTSVLAEYTEIETGKRSDRPELKNAIHRAELTNSTLVVAKLDRLARNSYFTGSLLESGLDFICCDNPHATKFTLQILAAVAEQEAKQISDRTREALQAAKARGVKLGSAREGQLVWKDGVQVWREAAWVGYEHLRGWRKAAAASVLARQVATQQRYQTLMPEIARRRVAGATMPELAEWLNSQGFVTRKQKPYTANGVQRLVARHLGADYLGYPGSKVRPVKAMENLTQSEQPVICKESA